MWSIMLLCKWHGAYGENKIVGISDKFWAKAADSVFKRDPNKYNKVKAGERVQKSLLTRSVYFLYIS